MPAFLTSFRTFLKADPAEGVGQPGHASVVFEILMIFTGFQQKKIEISQKLIRLIRDTQCFHVYKCFPLLTAPKILNYTLSCSNDFKIGAYI